MTSSPPKAPGPKIITLGLGSQHLSFVREINIHSICLPAAFPSDPSIRDSAQYKELQDHLLTKSRPNRKATGNRVLYQGKGWESGKQMREKKFKAGYLGTEEARTPLAQSFRNPESKGERQVAPNYVESMDLEACVCFRDFARPWDLQNSA